jgi:hypothetical protein
MNGARFLGFDGPELRRAEIGQNVCKRFRLFGLGRMQKTGSAVGTSGILMVITCATS